MAKVTAPLLSFGASGQVAQTQVYSKWKGRPYVRRHVIPANPQTAEQSKTRNAFTWLQNVYKFMDPLCTAPWEAYASGQVMTGRNAFTKANLPTLRPATDIDILQLSPGALGGLPPASFTVTPGNDQLTLAGTAPASTPDGWTAYSMVFAVILSQNPQSGQDYVITVVEDTAAAYSQVIGSLDEAEYQCFAWMKWTRPDGRIAYSPSLQDTGTPT